MRARFPARGRLALAAIVATGLGVAGSAGHADPGRAAAPPAEAAGAMPPAEPALEQAGALDPDPADPFIPGVTSGKWAGYFVTDEADTTDFTAVAANWTVTRVTCTSAAKQWAAFWVGMDGWWNDVVEQGGTEAICVHGSPRYQAWWEMFPADEMQGAFPVSPGDRIHATVTYQPASRTFRIVVQDRTSGRALRKTVGCRAGQDGCPRTSAEVVSEDIHDFGTGRLFPVPDYGVQADTSVTVTDARGHTGPLDDPAWQVTRITDARSGVTRQTTSGLGADGSSFTTSWRHQ